MIFEESGVTGAHAAGIMAVYQQEAVYGLMGFYSGLMGFYSDSMGY